MRFPQQALDNIAEHRPDFGSFPGGIGAAAKETWRMIVTAKGYSLLLPLKRGQMLPLIKHKFLGKLLPKEWGLQGLLRLLYAVDLLLDANSTEMTCKDRI